MYRFTTQLSVWSVSALLALAALVGLSNPSTAANCLADYRQLDIGKKSVRLRDFYCRGRDGTRVRIQFHRMTDLLVNSILSGNPPAVFEKAFGRPRLVENSVYREFKTLMDRFAGYVQAPCETYKIVTPGSRQALIPGYRCKSGTSRRKSLGGWTFSEGEELGYPFPAAADLKTLISTRRIPRNYEVIFNRDRTRATIWRYMTRADINNYKDKIMSFNQILLNIGMRDHRKVSDVKEFEFINYIIRDGLPQKFITLHAFFSSQGGCRTNPGWYFLYVPRALLVDVAVLENLSQRTIRIDRFFGPTSASTRLRGLSHSKRLRRASGGDLGLARLTLNPKETLVVFQRLAFVAPDWARTYMFKNFRRKPEFPPFVYGPEVLVRALKIDGEKYDLEGSSANFLAMTVGYDGASCPYVYAWSEEVNDWVNYGKIIHEAKGRAAEMAETRSFPGFVNRFRLAEEEPELAHIDQVRLTVSLKDGRELQLAPSLATLASHDGKRLKLYYGEYVEFAFQLPGGVERDEVVRSTLSVTGYYELYSDLTQASAHMCPSPASVPVPVPFLSGPVRGQGGPDMSSSRAD